MVKIFIWHQINHPVAASLAANDMLATCHARTHVPFAICVWMEGL